MSKESKPYQYFDTPDGEDLDKKLWIVLKPTIVSAIAISTIDVMLYSKPTGYMKTLGRYAYISLPLIGMSTVFVGATNLACSLRKKDDKLNWAIGGLAAGGVFGAWRKSVVAAWMSGAAFAILGIGKKYAVQNGFVIHPKEIRPAHGAIKAPRHDFTLTKDNPGAWREKN